MRTSAAAKAELLFVGEPETVDLVDAHHVEPKPRATSAAVGLRSSSSKKRASPPANPLAPVVLELGHGERHLLLHPLRRPRLLELKTRLYLIRVEFVVA